MESLRLECEEIDRDKRYATETNNMELGHEKERYEVGLSNPL